MATTPTQASNFYTGPISVSSTTTINAIASGNGFIQSSVSSATFILQTQVTVPQFSTAAGTYTSAQAITLSDGTPNAVIYYTLDGTNPTPASPIYSGPITVNAATTIKAFAQAPGFTDSPIAHATYVIESSGVGINFGNGFSTALTPQNGTIPMTLNGSAGLNDSRLRLSNGGLFPAASAFYSTPIDIRSFTNDFTFQLSNAGADGFLFTIQNSAPTAIGSPAGGLGYGHGVLAAFQQAPLSNSISITTQAKEVTRSVYSPMERRLSYRPSI
jgi:hypothetical protein